MGDAEQGDLDSEQASGDAVGDANDNRGKHFRALLTSPWVLGLTGTFAIGALIAVGAQVGFGIGAAAGGAILLVAIVIIWAVASRRAANDFFDAYATTRSLTRVAGRATLPPVTALLAKGDSRYTEELFNGTLPGGLVGSLALYTYEDSSQDSNGNTQTTYYHFTVAVSQLPETAPYISDLALQRRVGFRFMDSAEDVFRKRQRVELESLAADKKFEIFIGKDDDMNRARQVFTPTFIVWLGEEAHEKVAFELSSGTLVVNRKGHLKTADELDRFCGDSAVVARRLLSEATE